VVIGFDDTLERRRGQKINAKGIYRDPVRSSRAQVVKASGLRWLCATVLAEIPWARRVWAAAVPRKRLSPDSRASSPSTWFPPITTGPTAPGMHLGLQGPALFRQPRHRNPLPPNRYPPGRLIYFRIKANFSLKFKTLVLVQAGGSWPLG
jgi:hypothetical protein